VLGYLRTERSFDSARSIAGICQTSLTASIMRLVTLTSFRAAVVWSQENQVRWYKSSPEFSRWIRRGELNDATFAADCFKNRSVPGQLKSVPGSGTTQLCKRLFPEEVYLPVGFKQLLHTICLIRLDNGIRQHDRIKEVLAQVGGNAVLLQRCATRNDFGLILEIADSNVIA
jgi:hypothetical protein